MESLGGTGLHRFKLRPPIVLCKIVNKPILPRTNRFVLFHAVHTVACERETLYTFLASRHRASLTIVRIVS